MLTKRINIFTGHFGSGKTELAINFAYYLKQKHPHVAIDDLDVINPYFRTRDADEFFKKNEIELIAPPKRLTMADLPVVSPEIYRVLHDETYQVIIDAGGDKDGAKALGQYYHEWKNQDPEIIFVLNANRPYVSTLEGALTTISEIENAARMKVTGIINNTNIGKATTTEDILKGYELSLQISEQINIPVICTTISEHLKSQTIDFASTHDVVYIRRFMKLDWE